MIMSKLNSVEFVLKLQYKVSQQSQEPPGTYEQAAYHPGNISLSGLHQNVDA